MFDRKLPFSLEAEQAVLGSILIDPVSLDTIQIKKEDFYIPEHAAIFTAMQSMYVSSRSIDVVTLIDALTASGTYDDAGGREYLTIIEMLFPWQITLLNMQKSCTTKRYCERSSKPLNPLQKLHTLVNLWKP